MQKFEVMRVKDYQIALGCCKKTASKYRNQDLKTLNRRRITKAQFEKLYGAIEE